MQNFFNYMGDTIRKQSAFYTASGTTGAGAHIDARDIGAVAARVLTGKGHEGKAYELTGPEALTYDQAAADPVPGRRPARSSTCPSPPSS